LTGHVLLAEPFEGLAPLRLQLKTDWSINKLWRNKHYCSCRGAAPEASIWKPPSNAP
jgi:hypothetical protein